MGRLRRLLLDEHGIALLMALGVMIVMAIFVTGLISYTTGNGRAAARSASRVQDRIYAEAGVNYTQAILQKQLAGGNPAAANLLGCAGAGGAADTTGPSNCASPTPMILCFKGATCTNGSADSAVVYGYYSGTSSQTFLGRTIPASTWLIVSTGYASDSAKGGVNLQTSYARVHISSANSGAVAAVWNHVFLTKPLVANTCQTDFSSNNLVIDVPLYVIGNLCFSGNNNIVKEVGQAVDLQVGGKLFLNGGNNNSVGVSASTPITSGVVVGGCTNAGISSAGQTCAPPAYKYWVTTPDTYNAQAAPIQSATDIQNDYNSFDPGPKHACQSGTNPAPLASSVFDNDTTYNTSAASFELTPAASYSCISQNGASVGQLTWDAVAKKLTIAGSIFIDGNMTISQSAYYVGTAIIEVAGTVQIKNNSTTVCATSPCNTTTGAWQGSSGNNSMLTLAPLVSNTNAMTMVGNSETFQGSVWTQPSSLVQLAGNNDTLQGPLSMGSIDTPSNNASLKPMPVIKNMPVGAPVPPNIGVTLDPVVYDG